MEDKIAVIAVILDNPEVTQQDFNQIISDYRELIRGRLGLPLPDEELAAISLIAIGSNDRINSLTAKLEKIEGVNVKTSISRQTD
ncbi:MAG TPA: TM1266 family iron-only hydrogenase system putative regulator [Halanaerobiales bacterium]|nr:TM1266 family iron-only hydrogenase system putative regulator [Halanaerobiales bacterium]